MFRKNRLSLSSGWTGTLAICSVVTLSPLSGCFRPDIEVQNCAIPCGSACPDGYSCLLGVCAREGAESECSAGTGSGPTQTSTAFAAGGTSLGNGGSGCAGERCNAAGVPSYGGSAVIGGAGAGGETNSDGGTVPVSMGGAVTDSGGDGGAPNGGGGGEPFGAGGTDTLAPPTIAYAGPGKEPPEPCSGVEYRAAFRATGGTPPYVFRATALPTGFAFDAETRIVSTSAVSAQSEVQVALEVSDSAGRVAQRTFSLHPRSRCWLAYLSGSSGSGELRLFDPVRNAHLAPANAEPSATGVDLAFSPDGASLAYRVRLADDSYRLHVLVGPTFQEVPVTAHGSVRSYAWSPDSKLLAIAFEQNGQTSLGGLDFSAEPAVEPVNLEPVSADVRSEFTWFGAGFLAFSSLLETKYWTPSITRLSGDRFATPVSFGVLYDPGLLLRGFVSGFFAIDTTYPLLDHFGFDGPTLDQLPAYVTLLDSVMDPGGRYSARVSATTLGIYDLTTDAAPNEQPLASAADCGGLLAWAEWSERLACTSKTGGVDAVRVYTLNSSGTSLASQVVNGSENYPAGTALYRKRAFSRTGNWFSFTSEARLYIADTSSSVPYVVRTDGLLALPPDDPNVSRVALEFSPDERFLLQHRSSQLSLHRLDAVDAPAFVLQGINAPLAAAPGCQSEFLSDPANWCGANTGSADFAWSLDSQFVAYRTLAGKLLVVDLRALTSSISAQTIETLVADSSCDRCPFAFQPSHSTQNR